MKLIDIKSPIEHRHVDGFYRCLVTIEEAERLGAEAKRIREEGDIKSGDWVINLEGMIMKSETVLGNILTTEKGRQEYKSQCKKITNPNHVKTLNEIYEANK